MEEIVGIKLNELPLKFKYISDLHYFDGSLQSVFSDDEDNPYIYDWCDCDTNYNRWIIYKVSKELLYSFINKKVSCYDFLMSSDIYFIVDINNDLEYKNIIQINKENIPDSYKPEPDFLFDEMDLLTIDNLKQIIEYFNLNN